MSRHSIAASNSDSWLSGRLTTLGNLTAYYKDEALRVYRIIENTVAGAATTLASEATAALERSYLSSDTSKSPDWNEFKGNLGSVTDFTARTLTKLGTLYFIATRAHRITQSALLSLVPLSWDDDDYEIADW